MPYLELLKWVDYFKKRPIGWREDHRTYMIMAAFGVKEKPEKLFRSLEIITQKDEETVLPKGQWLNKMVNSKDGDHEWKPFWDTKNDETSNKS